jgi:hypothetical protein
VTTYLHWNQEELTIEHPDSLPPDEARAVVRKVLKSGQVPPIERDLDRQRGRRSWRCIIETGSGRYTVMIRRDSVTIEPADACEETEGLA